jgi:hypothetical protein
MSPRLIYPHLMPLEVPIWERFLASGQLDFLRVAYDVHVGEGAPIPDDATPSEVRQIRAITRKRIDAVGETRDAIWIIEVKPRAGHAAIGALLNYQRLYQREYRPRKPLRLAVVCERLEWDVQDYYRERGIKIFLV